MRQHEIDVEVLGPWSPTTSRTFWEGFTPAALPTDRTQHGATARIEVVGEGDLEAAAAQVARSLSLDVDARTWPDVGRRDPVIARAQAALAGLRPRGSATS